MSQIRLVEPPKEQFSWVKEFIATEVGEKFRYPKEFRGTVAPIKSKDVKFQMPGAVFKEDSKSDPEFIIIERIK